MTGPVKVGFGPAENMPGMAVEYMSFGPEGQAVPPPFKGSRFLVPPGATSEPDEHAVAEIWLVRSGTGTVLSAGSRTHIGPGDALYYPPWVPHQVTSTGEDPLEVFSLWWTPQPQ
ncbi:cupin domain-containing protein [Streptomyces sp. NPDC127110]|uniref:cupin domain-containing protein n=1 Tax=Streptomyces sp. NPDC127110 TaxID=3345362 RepID=UPI00362F56F6